MICRGLIFLSKRDDQYGTSKNIQKGKKSKNILNQNFVRYLQKPLDVSLSTVTFHKGP